MPDIRFPWPFPIPLPGRDPPGDRIYRDPEGRPIEDLREYLENWPLRPRDAPETPAEEELNDAGVILTPAEGLPPGTLEQGEPTPLPDPGSLPPDFFDIRHENKSPDYPPGYPILYERKSGRRIGRIIPGAFRGKRFSRRATPQPPALERGRLGVGNQRSLREVGRTQPRAGQRFPALPGAFAPTGGARIRPRDRRPRLLESEGLLAWQRPRTTPRPDRSRPRRGPRFKPGRDPFVWPRRRRKADEPLRRPVPRVPRPPPIRKVPPHVPDWTSPFPPSPRKLPPPRPAPSKQPLPVPPVTIPRTAPKTPPPKTPAPTVPRMPIPGFPPAPGSPGSPAPMPRPIPRGRPAPQPVPRVFPVPLPLPRSSPDPRRFSVPLPQPLPEPAPSPAPAPNPLPFANPLPSPAPAPLTRFNLDPLPFLNPQPDSERDRCEDERERRRKPSNVIARVKAYSRRMSQWSLDNLRRG